MNKKIKYTIVMIFILVLALISTSYYAFFITPKILEVKNLTITSEKIDDDLKNIQIAFITDIQYSDSNQEIYQKTLTKLKNINPEIIIFLGDLIETDTFLTEEMINEITSSLDDLPASLGKFVVLGEKDNLNTETTEIIKTIYQNSGFEIVSDSRIKIHNKTYNYFNLVGLQNIINAEPDIETAFSNVSEEEYTILIAHTPDLLKQVPTELIDLAVFGNSHSYQITLPVFGSIKESPGSLNYPQKIYHENTVQVEFVNSLGITSSKARLFNHAEILLLSFK